MKVPIDITESPQAWVRDAEMPLRLGNRNVDVEEQTMTHHTSNWSANNPLFLELVEQIAVGKPISEIKTPYIYISMEQFAVLDACTLNTCKALKAKGCYDHLIVKKGNNPRFLTHKVIEEIYSRTPRDSIH